MTSNSDVKRKLDHLEIDAAGARTTAQSLVSQAIGLAKAEKQTLPRWSGPWNSSNFEDYLGRLRMALKGPMAYQSRELLDEIGISTTNVATEVLEEPIKIQELVNKIQELSDIPGLVVALTAGGIVTNWLRVGRLGLDEAIDNIDRSMEIRAPLKRIVDLDLDERQRREFILLAFEDATAASEQAANLSSSLSTLASYKIDVKVGNLEIDSLLRSTQTLRNSIEELENVYSIPPAEVKKLVEGASIERANEAIDKIKQDRSVEYHRLSREWDLLTQTLNALGETSGEKPESLATLDQAAKDLETRCLEQLGKSGSSLLDFFLGDAKYPSNLKKSEIREALEKLRPFILRGLSNVNGQRDRT